LLEIVRNGFKAQRQGALDLTPDGKFTGAPATFDRRNGPLDGRAFTGGLAPANKGTVLLFVATNNRTVPLFAL